VAKPLMQCGVASPITENVACRGGSLFFPADIMALHERSSRAAPAIRRGEHRATRQVSRRATCKAMSASCRASMQRSSRSLPASAIPSPAPSSPLRSRGKRSCRRSAKTFDIRTDVPRYPRLPRRRADGGRRRHPGALARGPGRLRSRAARFPSSRRCSRRGLRLR